MLKGTNLTLRAVIRDDLPHYVQWFSDPDVTRHLLWFKPVNMDVENEWYERQLKDSTTLNFAIVITATQKHIGSVSLGRIDHKNQVAELGIVIGDKSEWGKGYCREAIRLLLAYGFNTLNLNRIYLHVFTENIAGKKCYEHCGFKLEGELREANFSNGNYINHYIMSVLRREFQSR